MANANAITPPSLARRSGWQMHFPLREFVLLPLAEIAPSLVLPCGTPLTELVARCPRNGLEILADATGE